VAPAPPGPAAPGPALPPHLHVPATLRPFPPSHHTPRPSHVARVGPTARKRLAADERLIGTDLPGCTGVLHHWGRHRPSHPHIHSIVPGGGIAQDRTPWQPSRAHCLSRDSPRTSLRALFKKTCPTPASWSLATHQSGHPLERPQSGHAQGHSPARPSPRLSSGSLLPPAVSWASPTATVPVTPASGSCPPRRLLSTPRVSPPLPPACLARWLDEGRHAACSMPAVPSLSLPSAD